MAIQIGGTTVISDDFNIENVNDMRVGLITFFGSSGNIDTPGIVSVGALDFPPSVVSFSPVDGATSVDTNTNIVITFNQFVEKPTTGIGTTANITLRNSSGIGTVLQTIGVTSTSVTINRSVVTIVLPSLLPNDTNVYVVIDEGAFVDSFGGNSPLIDTYDFSIKSLELGDPFEGGFLICCASSVYWIVSPSSAEVSRVWNSRTDSNTLAQQVSGCTGWFIPSVTQLQNPGYCCRTYWDSIGFTNYWSDTSVNAQNACGVSFVTGAADNAGGYGNINFARGVRSFRCVTY